jgi:DNA primase
MSDAFWHACLWLYVLLFKKMQRKALFIRNNFVKVRDAQSTLALHILHKLPHKGMIHSTKRKEDRRVFIHYFAST